MLKALNLIGMYVTDVQKSVEFYVRLGFGPASDGAETRDAGYVQLSDFRLQFIAKDSAADKPAAFQRDAFGEPKGTGLYLNIEVDDIDGLYKTLTAGGVKASGEPRSWSWGQREFVVRDPDGYKLVFYQVIR
jgi:catechol 2,3-dioxygenase-like lactoylglutathione lyase family enzyme